jgi:hypothetical protein
MGLRPRIDCSMFEQDEEKDDEPIVKGQCHDIAR